MGRVDRTPQLLYFQAVSALSSFTVMSGVGENSGRPAEAHDGVDRGHVTEPVRGTGESVLPVPRGTCPSNHEQRKKLVLHVDLNNTILVSDAVTAQGTVAALDYFLTTVTWGKMNKHGKLDPGLTDYCVTKERVEFVCAESVRR